ncbi:hypothetical protein ACJJTC_002033 [Scirpophaga incertulas]
MQTTPVIQALVRDVAIGETNPNREAWREICRSRANELMAYCLGVLCVNYRHDALAFFVRTSGVMPRRSMCELQAYCLGVLCVNYRHDALAFFVRTSGVMPRRSMCELQAYCLGVLCVNYRHDALAFFVRTSGVMPRRSFGTSGVLSRRSSELQTYCHGVP